MENVAAERRRKTHPGGVGLAVSADGKSLLYDDKGDLQSSIMLVKNFR